MRQVALVLALVLLVSLTTRVFAQTPDDATPTPEPTELAAPTATATTAPIVAAPDEIVFTGELPLAAGTRLRASFQAPTSPTPVECGSTQIPPAGPNEGLARFVLAIDANCAEGKFGPRLCWSDEGCYVHFADRRECARECPWSDTVAPGKVVDVGYIPVAPDGGIAFVGQVPAPDGTPVVLRVGNWNTLTFSTCDSTTSVAFDNSGVSTFILNIYAECIPVAAAFLATFCWTDSLCDSYTDQFIAGSSLVPGETIGVGLLRDHSGTPTPLPGVPNVGQYPGHSGKAPSWLPSVLAGLFALALVLGASGFVARQRRSR